MGIRLSMMGWLLSLICMSTVPGCGESEVTPEPTPVTDTQGDGEIVPVHDSGTPVTDTAVPDDTHTNVDSDAPTDSGTPSDWSDCTDPGTTGCPCVGANDCFSGFCVTTESGKLCTRTCDTTCPAGWSCSDVASGGRDIQYICVPLFTNLCRPCTDGADCKQLGGTGGYCVPFGEGQGSFCGGQCEENADCPADYGCQSVDLGQGLNVNQCAPLQEACECNDLAIMNAASTPCLNHNAHGSCPGTRTCGPGGLGECEGPVAEAELCNGADDNCDGVVDDVEPGACELTNEAGTCAGVQACAEGAWLPCDAKTPEQEVCDGIDDDCDGQIDEGTSLTFFTDADGDGYGDSNLPVEACEQGANLVDNADDCDDTDAEVHPGQTETCDGFDNDCNGEVDDGALWTFYVDQDKDGYGNPLLSVEACAPGPNTVANADDCNDLDPAVNPGQAEACDGIDNNCDGLIDDGHTITLHPDADQDGYGDPSMPVEACFAQAGLVEDNTDCNDQDPTVNPGLSETCDYKDNNCNGQVDEGVTKTLYADTDQDGYGNPAVSVVACGASTGLVADNTDCNDQDPAVNPGLVEGCDGKDNNCNGAVDEGVTTTFYADTDHDGYGNAQQPIIACYAGPGLVENDTDCNDSDAAVNPGANEACDYKDNNCDGSVDEGLKVTLHIDADKDGYGNPLLPIDVCFPGPGLVEDNTDCNDSDPAINPGANEVCDYKDNNCDNSVDEGLKVTLHIDADKDGYGNPLLPIDVCFAGPGLVEDNTDCNDFDPAMNPGANEVCDYKDNNCDDAVDEGVTFTYYPDADGDGYGNSVSEVVACAQPNGYVALGGDCDDAQPGVFPGAAELCNHIDDDCDEVVDGHTQPCATDCGVGEETCVAGAFEGCTAPIVTVITSTQLLANPPAEYNFACLDVKGTLQIEADVTVAVSGFIRVTGHLHAGPRAKLVAGDDLRFKGQATLSAVDLTLEAGGTVSIGPDATWYLESAMGLLYSGGGGKSCINGTGSPLHTAGAGGGARGGNGGMGAVCGSAVSTAPAGTGNPGAEHGADGVNCQAGNVNPLGGIPSGGSGGAPYSGGGGGGNGGVGGQGTNGYHPPGDTTYWGGNGALAEAAAPGVPQVGGGGGGSGGWGYCGYYCSNRCPAGGGYGAGIARVRAPIFVNQGVISARGQAGGNGDGGGDVPSSSGGGGGGAGGSLVYAVDTFDNTGLIVAIGGTGGTGGPGVGKCGGGHGGGGGGGGGGRVHITGFVEGEAPSNVTQGIIQINGGKGGKMNCTGAFAEDGSDGWVHDPSP